MKHLQSQYGFTVLELILVISILAIVVSFGSGLLSGSASTYVEARNSINSAQIAQVPIMRLHTELSTLRAGTDLIAAGPGYLSYRMANGDWKAITRTDNSLLYWTRIAGTGDWSFEIIADNTTNLSFRYFDESGASIANPGININNGLPNVYWLQADITVSKGTTTRHFHSGTIHPGPL